MRLFSTIAVLALLLGAPALAETSVGVTAAVNPDATGTVGSTVRTISLGDSVVFNQRIETGGTGLVQVLLADGTTFMVGPNSNLVIDSFVYDPNAGTAQVTASFTKGVLRFIGGQTSKTEGGVTINTPVGTMGIRGAMVDIVLDPPAGTPPHIDMLFGNEVTLEQGQQLLGRLYAAGYSLALGPNGGFDVLKTPPGWGSQIQAALAGKTGATGGAPKGPSDGDVQNSEVANKNSGNGVDKNSVNQPLTQDEIDALLEAAALYDELRNFIVTYPTEPQGPVTSTQSGFAAGVVRFSGLEELAVFPFFSSIDYDDMLPINTSIGFNAYGDAIAIDLSLGHAACVDCVGIEYSGGRSGGAGTLFLSDGGSDEEFSDGEFSESDEPLVYEVAFQGSGKLKNSSEIILPSGAYCVCSFASWGVWGLDSSSFSYQGQDGTIDVPQGLWVTGDLTTSSELYGLSQASENAGMLATYAGHATGVVSNIAGDSTYLATSSMELVWSFGNRRGGLILDDFDGRLIGGALDANVYGGIYDDEVVGVTTGFTGRMYDYDHQNFQGRVQGAFVRDGTSVAGGVIGDFNFSDPDNDWAAAGVFLGARGNNEIHIED